MPQFLYCCCCCCHLSHQQWLCSAGAGVAAASNACQCGSPLVMVRKRSCPAVSHICSFTHLLSRKIFLILKSILHVSEGHHSEGDHNNTATTSAVHQVSTSAAATQLGVCACHPSASLVHSPSGAQTTPTLPGLSLARMGPPTQRANKHGGDPRKLIQLGSLLTLS